MIWIIIFTGVFAALFIMVAALLFYLRKKKKITYVVDENEKYLRQLYQTFMKYLPFVFLLCALACVMFLIRLLGGF